MIKEALTKWVEGRGTIEQLEERVQHLEIRCTQLLGENEDLHKAVEKPERIKVLEERVRTLGATLEKVLNEFRKEAVGVEQMALMRTARVVLAFVRDSESSGTTSSESSPVTTSGSAERPDSSSE